MRLKLTFIAWREEIMLRTGHQLRTAITTVSSTTTASYQAGGPLIAGADAGMMRWSQELSKAEIARVIVSTLSQEKLPLSTSHSWVTTMNVAAISATGCGAKRPKGVTSWATWLPAVSIRCSRLGRRWKYQL